MLLLGATHPKAMPVIMTTEEKINVWRTAPPEQALTLQRPLANDAITIVAKGQRQDGLDLQ